MKLSGLWSRLSAREKLLILGTGVLLALFLVYQAGYAPLLRARAAYRAQAEEMAGRLQTLTLLAEAHLQSRERYRTLAGALDRGERASVLSYLEDEAHRAGVRELIEYIRPGSTGREGVVTRSQVEMKIDAVNLAGLVEFLSAVERNREGLTVTYLRLKPFFRDRSKVDALVRITDVTVEE
ncbi:MAG: type II secretion system protein GspM [Spirochaetota bacterium]